VVQQIRQWSSQLFHNNPATQTFTHQWAMLLQSYCVPESPAIAPPMEVLRQWPLYSCMSVIPSCQETTTPPPECEQFA
jgi:hypothetical protein